MSTQPPTRLASEDVIINAPMSYAGSAQRLFRLRRLGGGGVSIALITLLAILLVLVAWTVVTAWYLTWGLWLVPYRLLRRGSRKRKAEAMRHRELMGTIQGSAAASAAAIVAASATVQVSTEAAERPDLRIDSSEREQAAAALGQHYVAGRLTEDELNDRLSQTYAARTRGELSNVLGDLPQLTSGQPTTT
jgi:hypothetical protein